MAVGHQNLITGAAGVWGGAVVGRCLADGCRVAGLDVKVLAAMAAQTPPDTCLLCLAPRCP